MRSRTAVILAAVAAACLAFAGPGCAEADTPGTASAVVRCEPPPPRLHSSARTKTAFRRLASSERTGRGLVVGIDGGWGGWGRCETRHRAALGAAITRHEWALDQPVAAQDELVFEAATKVRTRFHALLGANELGDPGAYRAFVLAFIRRYGVGGDFWRQHPGLNERRYAIRTFELGNEPYFGEMSAGEYADAVRPALAAVKRQQLPAKLVVVSRVEGTDASWLETLYEEIPNLNSYVHAFAEHPYWYGHDPAEPEGEGPFLRIETLRETLDSRGAAAKPIFITEYGESTAACGEECVSEKTQAAHLQAMIRFCRQSRNRVQILSIYQLLDRGTEDADRELQFGIIREDGSLKPSYGSVRRAITGSGR